MTLCVSLWRLPNLEYPLTGSFASIKQLHSVAAEMLEKLAIRLPVNKLSVVVSDFSVQPVQDLMKAYPIPELYVSLGPVTGKESAISIRVVSPVGHNLEFKGINPARTYLHQFKEQICERLGLAKWAAYYISLFTSDQGIFQLTASNRTLLVNDISRHCNLFLEFKPNQAG